MTKLPTPPPSQASIRKVLFESVKPITANRILLYGTGGIGKTTLALKLPGKTAFIEPDNSLGKLQAPANVVRVPCVATWSDARAALAASGWDGVQNIVIDTASTIEKWCAAHIIKTVQANGKPATSLESYGYGKGYTLLYESMMLLLSDLDRHFQAGRNVVLIAHDTTSNVPNPEGEDFIRWEPDLFQNKQVSVRTKVKAWADQVLFLHYDRVVSEDGKASGSGTRTLYTREQATFMAKSRTTDQTIVIPDSSFDPWPIVFGQQ